MSQKRRLQWERTRAKGKRRFVVLYGLAQALGSVVAAGILFRFFPPLLSLTTPMIYFITLAVGFFLSGVVGASFMWRYNEEQYRNAEE